MRYVHPAPESKEDVRYDYHWRILATALERTRAKWGPYALEAGPLMSEPRQVVELSRPGGALTVIHLDTTPDMERDLLPVRIPVDRNLVGYRVLLIRKEDQPRFTPQRIRTLEDLKRLTFGLGLGWVDVGIMRHNGFNVVTGSDYEGLFAMLASGRFDAFPRGAAEVLAEFDRRKETFKGLHIEENFLLYYPLPMYFWFPRTPQGERLAARAKEGMLAMIADGTYERIFRSAFKDRIERLGLAKRRVFRLDNPYLVPETPFGDRRLWFTLGGAP
jgi:ABC-type amino acid transport substrate-binding protein